MIHIVIKCRPSFTKYPSLVLIRLVLTKIQPFGNVKIYNVQCVKLAIQTLSNTTSGWPYISLLILTFLNPCISVKTSLISSKLGDFVNISTFFLTVWINSCLSHHSDSYLVLHGLKSGNVHVCEAIISICNRWELEEFKMTCKLVFNRF